MASLPHPSLPEWRISPGLTDYPVALAAMESQVDAMIAGKATEQVWLVEHPPVITGGTSAASAELLEPGRFPLFTTGRGGRFTYHGPGQRIVYPMLDLGQRGRDVRRYVWALESWAITALHEFGIQAFAHEAGTGIWVQHKGSIAKIGAIGVRVRRWVSFHGMAINLSPDLSHYSAIIPCGIAAHGVTRIVDHAPGARMADLDLALARHFPAMLDALYASSARPMKTLETREDCR